MELQKYKSDEERFDIFAKHFVAQSSMLSLTNLKTLYTTMYKHVLIIRKYDAVTRIKSLVTLLKPTFPFLPEAEEDYGLHKVIRYMLSSQSYIYNIEKVSKLFLLEFLEKYNMF